MIKRIVKGQKLGKAKWEIFCVYLTFFAASGLPRSRARAKVVAELYAAAGLAAIEEHRVKTWMRMGDGKQAGEAPSWVCRRQYVGMGGGLRLYGCVPVQALSVLAAIMRCQLEAQAGIVTDFCSLSSRLKRELLAP